MTEDSITNESFDRQILELARAAIANSPGDGQAGADVSSGDNAERVRVKTRLLARSASLAGDADG